MIEILKSKIHSATVSESSLLYEGSVSIPVDILHAANIIEYERVYIYNITNGERFDTYAIRSQKSGVFSVNGAGARKVQVGDKLIICAYQYINGLKIEAPVKVLLDHYNQIKNIS